MEEEGMMRGTCWALLLFVALSTAGTARAQVGTPPACGNAAMQRERFTVGARKVRFHLSFDSAGGKYDASCTLTLPRHRAVDACTAGDAVDMLAGQLSAERHRWLPSSTVQRAAP
jgi:hypothetical protein